MCNCKSFFKFQRTLCSIEFHWPKNILKIFCKFLQESIYIQELIPDANIHIHFKIERNPGQNNHSFCGHFWEIENKFTFLSACIWNPNESCTRSKAALNDSQSPWSRLLSVSSVKLPVLSSNTENNWIWCRWSD